MNKVSHLHPLKLKDRAGIVTQRWASAPVLKIAAHALAINHVDFLDSESFLRRESVGRSDCFSK